MHTSHGVCTMQAVTRQQARQANSTAEATKHMQVRGKDPYAAHHP